MSLDAYTSALGARDVIKELVRQEIARLRPGSRYGTVVAFDRVNRTASISFPEGGDFATVGMGAVQPSYVGEIVRIDGIQGDRYIGAIMGRAYIAQDVISATVSAGTQLGRAETTAPFNIPTSLNPYEGLVVPVDVPAGNDVEIEAFLPWVQLLTGSYVELQLLEDQIPIQTIPHTLAVNAFSELSIKVVHGTTPGLHTYILGVAVPAGTATSSTTTAGIPIIPYLVVKAA